jgi:hypothetical protein
MARFTQLIERDLIARVQKSPSRMGQRGRGLRRDQRSSEPDERLLELEDSTA